MFQQDTIQYSKPLFVRNRHRSIKWKGQEWSYNEYFPWQELGVPEDKVKTWFDIGMVYHNEDLEEETKVGDRLAEFSDEKLLSFIRQVNSELKQRCSTTKEYDNKKIKFSKIREKQQGLIRSWLYRNPNLAEEVYFPLRDKLLDG